MLWAEPMPLWLQQEFSEVPERHPLLPLASRVEMKREDVLNLVQSHLAEELGLEPSGITVESNLRDDLEADSLDLYTLLQEVEDRLGVKISDERAAEIETVGQAVDVILAEAGGESGG